ncbi:MAG: hypothetical protein PPP58_04820 [Natronomonas sp.]
MGSGGLLTGVKIDVVRLHETWMELLFPRQRTAVHAVLGKWKPRTRGDRIKYRIWGVIGVPIVAVLYPFLLVGFFARFNARRLDSATTRLGLLGVLLATAVVWGLLTALARLRFDLTGFLAVGAASVVAVVSAGLAVGFRRLGGRVTTVVFAYPMAMNALFLPPVVAALFEPSLSFILDSSRNFALFMRDSVFVGPLSPVWDLISARFELAGIGYVLMWVSIAVPLGWILGCTVTLADLVRPQGSKSEDDSETAAG